MTPVFSMKDSFIVKLAVELGFKTLALQFPAISWLFIGCPANFLEFFAIRYLGFLADKGILVIDLSKDSIEIALHRRDYREAAIKAYKKATAKVYTEEEKRAIRKQYLDTIRKFVSVGDGLRVRKHP